jgi:thymidylate synthase
MMIAQVCDLEAGEFIHTLMHTFTITIRNNLSCNCPENQNHQKMILNPTIKDIFQFDFDDFTLEGYEPHPLIKEMFQYKIKMF